MEQWGPVLVTRQNSEASDRLSAVALLRVEFG
jgi:hypothetical protein